METYINVVIKSGAYEGKEGFMLEGQKLRNGKVLVELKGYANRKAAYIAIELIAIVEDEKVKDNMRWVIFAMITGKRKNYEFMDFISDMVTEFTGSVDIMDTERRIDNQSEFDEFIKKEAFNVNRERSSKTRA